MGEDRTRVLYDLSDVYGPGTVVIDGDWREASVAPGPVRRLLRALRRGVDVLLFLSAAVVIGVLLVVSILSLFGLVALV